MNPARQRNMVNIVHGGWEKGDIPSKEILEVKRQDVRLGGRGERIHREDWKR